MTQPAKGQDQTMEEILSSIRRIISDEPARFPAAEPRTETVRNDRRSTDSRRDDFLRDDDLRGELRARLLRQEGGTRPETRVEDRPLKPAPEEPAQDFPPMQSRPQPSALTLDGIPSALEAELQHSDIEAMLAKLHGSEQRVQVEEPAPDIFEQTGTAGTISKSQLTGEENRSERTYGDLAGELEKESKPSAFEEEDEEPQPIHRHSDSEAPQRAIHPSQEPRSFSQQSRQSEKQALLSDATSAAVDAAFNALAETVLVQNGRTLEDLVGEMLRPMLKSWLDDNLPNLVERLVRAEIERVSRGR
jgi:uncharacterized protein